MIFLKKLWRRWLVIAHVIGNFQAQVILTVFYLLFFLPLGAIVSFLLDPLRMRTRVRSNFQKWEHSRQSLEEAKKQF